MLCDAPKAPAWSVEAMPESPDRAMQGRGHSVEHQPKPKHLEVLVNAPQALAARSLAMVAAGAAVLTATAAGSLPTAAPVLASAGPAAVAPSSTVPVLVREDAAAGRAPEAAARRLGGVHLRRLPLISGFAVRLPTGALRRLAAVPGVLAISPDARMRVQGGASTAALPSVYNDVVRATDLHRTGLSGAGTTVALVDTGIADVPDLSGRVQPVRTSLLGTDSARCLNLSGEAGCGDSYGHGTFIGGLIAGNGAASGGQYAGVAPGTRLVSVKIAGRDGSADVSTVIAAIQWVVSVRNRYGIRVLNLSLGTDSTQSYHLDPLNYAVEKAWHAGIVVVVAASNRGPGARTISKPGDDPFVITVGAVDDNGTRPRSDDRLPNFSAHGPTASDGLDKPDVVAPGAHLVSLSAPGSAVEEQVPSSMPAPYRRGSGTSMATGVVSGVAALMLQANPSLSPDRVKYALTATTKPDASSDPMAVGSGLVDAYAATVAAPPGLANQGLDESTGTGSLQDSRGTVQVRASAAVATPVISGELTAQLRIWDPIGFRVLPWTELTWYTSQWAGSNWEATDWEGSNWEGSNWEGSNWESTSSYGSNWEGSTWYGAWDR